MPIGFSQPVYLWLLLLAVPVAWSGWRYLRPLSRARRRWAVVIRVLALVLIVLALAGVQMVRQHHDLTVIAVVDESESMQRFSPRDSLDASVAGRVATLGDWMRQWLLHAAHGRRADDQLGLLTYDARPTVVTMPSSTSQLTAGMVPQPREGSRGGAAIRLAMAMLPPDTSRRLVLVSDGNDTAEVDLLAAARQAASAGVPIDVLPVEYALRNEVMVEGLYTPAQAREGQTAPVRVVLRSTSPVGGSLHLMRNGVAVDLNGPQPGTGAAVSASEWVTARGGDDDAGGGLEGRYTLVRVVDLPLPDNGANRFEAVFEAAASDDAIAANNRATSFTLVSGQGKVLMLSNEPADQMTLLSGALAGRGIETHTAPGGGLPGDLAALSQYDTIVMLNVPAEQMDDSQQQLLSQYVSDTGGGLLVIGGPDSFGAGGWNNTELSRIFPVECEIPSQLILPTGALVLVIDRSGSMAAGVSGTARTQQEVAAEAAILAIATLYPRDMLGVVSFDSEVTWEVPLAVYNDRRPLVEKIRQISPRGGTHIYRGLEEAYYKLADVNVDDMAVKHIILLTDGQSMSGNYPELLARMRQRGITLSTIGVGDGVEDAFLQGLAQQGKGEYYPVRDPRKLPQVFIKEARTIRKNLIREVNFTPKLVNSGSAAVAGLTELPQLQGFVRTEPRRDPRVFMAMVGPEDEPILAHWQVGLGQVAAFTSDASTRWAARWANWPGYGDFWSRMVRMTARPASSANMELVTRFEDDHLHISIDTTKYAGDEEGATGQRGGQSGAYEQMRDLAAAVVGPDGQKQLVKLAQAGPGLYEAKVPASASGSYLVSALGEDSEGRRQFVSGGANRPAGLELRRFASNRALLEQVALITGGRVLDAQQGRVTSLFTRDASMVASRSVRPLWRLLVWLLLPLFLVDVATRRLSWDPTALRAWLGLREQEDEQKGGRRAGLLAKVRGRGVAGEAQGAGRAAGGVKTVAGAVETAGGASVARGGDGASAQARPGGMGAAGAAGKAGLQAGKSAALSAGQATGKSSGESAGQRGEAKAEKAGSEDENGTSRLLSAKRRARQRMEDQ